MCGIAGYITVNNILTEETLNQFLKCQHHRGPDASGKFIAPGVGLAHNRLSILDTSTKANQPFTSSDGRYVMVYNGEVYNYREFQKQIDTDLRTASDTEVILEMFVRHGHKCVDFFRGMFAFVIYDKVENCLWIFRDRFGIKPLYYYLTKDTFIFASELKAIADLSEIKDKLSHNKESINHFLHLGFIPSSSTVFNEIHAFPSAAYGKIGFDMKLETWNYWKASDFTNTEKTGFNKAKSRIKDLLFASVEEHLISDVPVGLFLSGGIDSSLLAAIATKIYSSKIKTFTIGLNGIHNEAPYARKIAEYLGTEHHESYLSDSIAMEFLNNVNDTYDEPFADTSSIPTMLVSELAAKHVKVAMSGEGADEIFLGYNSYNWASRLNNPLIRAGLKPLQSLNRILNDPRFSKVDRMLKKSGSHYLAAEIYSSEHGFYSSEEVSLLRKTKYKGFEYKRTSSAMTDQILFELEVALKDGLLVKMDRASMKFGLEARVPFLDHRLVEYVLSLSLEHKFKPNKHILKELLFEMIPVTYFNRKKWGFGLSSEHPIRNYILQNLIDKNKKANNLPRLFASYVLENNKYMR
ncbi:MAG: asparagine synthase (glutamine-hydrolyzing) [Opitutaceae bacterium]|nr:asparagine synthase (glutamine-hydrolyzing) [Cytophagales bacterium]